MMLTFPFSLMDDFKDGGGLDTGIPNTRKGRYCPERRSKQQPYTMSQQHTVFDAQSSGIVLGTIVVWLRH